MSIILSAGCIRFKAADAGTYWWHAHNMQRADGAFGPIRVREPAKRNVHHKLYDYDLSDHIIIINDWVDESFVQRYTEILNGYGGLQPDTILINGMGSYASGVKTPKAVFTVKAGFRYRFRVIYAGHNICPIQFAIDGHNLTVVASDGRDIVPVEVDGIQLMAGNDYFIFQTRV
jgi:L-ascorbate oxidase